MGKLSLCCPITKLLAMLHLSLSHHPLDNSSIFLTVSHMASSSSYKPYLNTQF